MKKWLASCISFVLILSMLAACSQSSSDNGGDTGSGGSEGDGEKTHAIVFRSAGNPYGEKLMDGFKTAVEEVGGEAILRSPEQATASGQIQIIEQLIAQQVDSITVAANDQDALEPVLKKAMNQEIKVLSVDAEVNANSRMVHINQADPERIGRVQVQAISEMIGGEGQIAVLSATSQSPNQNLWIDWMEKELEKTEYNEIELVEVAYGDDQRDKSVSETEALLKSYPDLKGIISPTTVGIAAAAKVITDKDLKGKVQLTGLGLPSEMAEYIKSGVSQWMYLWNPIDVGYLAGQAAHALVEEEISGKPGETFDAGRLNEREVVEDGDGSEVMLGDPFRFDVENIDEWKEVY
jgi:rhamnose transport system substrate-binding protein